MGVLALACLCLAYAQTAEAGAWNQAEGRWLLISSGVYNEAALAYDEDSQPVIPVSFQKIEHAVYAEYGLSKRLTLVGKGAIQDVRYTSSAGPQNFTGFSTSKIGVRIGLKKRGAWAMSVQPSVVIPAGGEGIPDGDLGIGGYGIEMRALAGRSVNFGKFSGFIDGQIAYEKRGGGAPQQVSADVTVGINPSPRIQILGQGFLNRTNNAVVEARDPVLENRSLKLQLSAVYRFNDRTSLQVGGFRSAAGKNIVREQGGLVSLWTEF